MSKTIIEFLKYIDHTEWIGRKTLDSGTILWAGHNITQYMGDDGIDWDEVIVVEFTEDRNYNEALKRLNVQKLKNYKVLLVDPIPQTVFEKANQLIKSFSNSSIDTTLGVDIKKKAIGGPIRSTPQQVEKLLQRDQNQSVVI